MYLPTFYIKGEICESEIFVDRNVFKNKYYYVLNAS